MAEQRVQRKLAAILAADVVGYSRLIEGDEEGTRARLGNLHEELIGPRIAADGGRIVKTTGDGILAEFPSAVDAVRSALGIQEAVGGRNADVPAQTRIEFRIGINLGDVIVEGDDIHGDGVNVAARLEGLCEPGEVYVSGGVHDQVAGKIAATFDDLGEHTVKNIARPIRVYWARIGSEATARLAEGVAAVPLPTKPSIAVLPFRSLGDDPSQHYFADGLRLAIQASLVHIPGLLVISPPGVDRFRDRDLPAPQIARELGVRYVLEGTAQHAAGRIRITVQLTDAASGRVVWAERYDREAVDVLAVQDEITVNVVKLLDAKLVSSELAHLAHGALTRLDALTAFYRGLSHFYARSKDDNAAAKRAFEEVYRLQPEAAAAASYLSMCHWIDASMGWTESKNRSLMQAVEWAERTLEFEFSNGLAHIVVACIHLLNRRHDEALAMCYEAIERRPVCPISNITLGQVLHFCGHPAEAVQKAKTAMRIMHVYPPWFLTLLAAAYRDIGDVDQSMTAARQALEMNPKYVDARLVLCSDYAASALPDQARKTAREILEIDPAFAVSEYAETQPYKDPETLRRLTEALRNAGLPE